MRPISLVRFDALAGYCRDPRTFLFADEMAWFEHGNERVLASLIRDKADNDYGGVILARDRRGRYRWVFGTQFHVSRRRAEIELRREMERISAAPDEEYHQGDERGEPLDFFMPTGPQERLNPNFVSIATLEGYAALRGIITPMMHWYEDMDGNFVQQFQTTGFDARIWELYLFATFVEMGYRIEHIHAVPDFTCVGLQGQMCVEAVTVNPTRDRSGAVVPPPPQNTSDEKLAYLREYMPIKYGSSLTAKLDRRYWEKSNVGGRPLLFAIQDFHAPMSMIGTQSSLPIYLYGYDHGWSRDESGELTIHPRKVESHRWGEKVIPSGFFNLPGAENISAVIFSNSGTVAKFNRMGVVAGFGSERVILVRTGFALDLDPNATEPKAFRQVVNEPGYEETWTEGLQVYHNPRALNPIEMEMIPEAVHHRLLPDGRIESTGPDWQPLSSVTLILVPEPESGN